MTYIKSIFEANYLFLCISTTKYIIPEMNFIKTCDFLKVLLNLVSKKFKSFPLIFISKIVLYFFSGGFVQCAVKVILALFNNLRRITVGASLKVW